MICKWITYYNFIDIFDENITNQSKEILIKKYYISLKGLLVDINIPRNNKIKLLHETLYPYPI